MNGDIVLLLLFAAATLLCAALVLLLVILVHRRRRPRTPMEAARRAVRGAARESARLGRSGLRGKGSGRHGGDSSFTAGDGGNGI